MDPHQGSQLSGPGQSEWRSTIYRPVNLKQMEAPDAKEWQATLIDSKRRKQRAADNVFLNNFQDVLLFKSVCAKSAGSSSKHLDLCRLKNPLHPLTLVIRSVFLCVGSTFQDICAYSRFNDSKERSLPVIPNWRSTGLLSSKASRSRMPFTVLSPLVLKLLALKYSEVFAV